MARHCISLTDTETEQLDKLRVHLAESRGKIPSRVEVVRGVLQSEAAKVLKENKNA